MDDPSWFIRKRNNFLIYLFLIKILSYELDYSRLIASYFQYIVGNYGGWFQKMSSLNYEKLDFEENNHFIAPNLMKEYSIVTP